MSSFRRTILAVILLVGLPGSLFGQGRPATVEDIAATLERAVSSVSIRDFALCELRAGVWGSYDVTVRVASSATGVDRPLIFRIASGFFFEEVAASSPSSLAESERQGIVGILTREQAFARGVPFFIGDTVFDSPTVLRYTVFSNPAASLTASTRVLEIAELSPGFFSRSEVIQRSELSSNATPQTRTWTFNPPPNPDSEVALALVTTQFTSHRCLVSNEIDVIALAATTPRIRSSQPVLQAFDNSDRLSSGTWIQIFGKKLSRTTRGWASADFRDGRGPTELDGVRVTVNGRPAYISFVSPGQVNVQAPDDNTDGPVNIQVTSPDGSSNRASIRKSRVSPALLTTNLFRIGGRQYVAALTSDFAAFIAPQSLVPGVQFRPARPGETLVIFAVGCGSTDPPAPAGEILAEARPLSQPLQVRFGDTVAQAQGFLAAQAVGLCQLNVTVPNVPDGDLRLDASVGGVSTGQTLFIAVRR